MIVAAAIINGGWRPTITSTLSAGRLCGSTCSASADHRAVKRPT